METSLWAHPAFGNHGLRDIQVTVERPSLTLIRLHYTVLGNLSDIDIPASAAPARTPGLWESTCFELFLRRDGDDGYLELNFSPSGQWAAYAFSSYRAGMAQAALPGRPDIRALVTSGRLDVTVAVSPWLHDGPHAINLTAVIRDKAGSRSFWAAHHAKAEPDFHDPRCFIDQLPAAPGS